MPRLRLAAITKAVKAVEAAGQRIGRVEVKPDGTVVVHTVDQRDQSNNVLPIAGDNEWDEVLKPAGSR